MCPKETKTIPVNEEDKHLWPSTLSSHLIHDLIKPCSPYYSSEISSWSLKESKLKILKYLHRNKPIYLASLKDIVSSNNLEFYPK